MSGSTPDAIGLPGPGSKFGEHSEVLFIWGLRGYISKFLKTAIILHNKQPPNLIDLEEHTFCAQMSVQELVGPALLQTEV